MVVAILFIALLSACAQPVIEIPGLLEEEEEKPSVTGEMSIFGILGGLIASPDFFFSGDGFFAHGGAGADAGYAVATQSDGKILIAGQSHNGANRDLSVWRLNGDGVLDTAFSGDGHFVHDAGGDDFGYAIAAQPDGKILIAGQSHNGTTDDLAVWRLTADGVLDPTFAGGGRFAYDSAGNDLGYSLVLQADGRITVAGQIKNATGSDLGVWRLTADGVLDASFDTDGVFQNDYSVAEYGRSVALQPDGKIVVAGAARGVAASSSVYHLAVWRLTADGVLDVTFSDDGIATQAHATGRNSHDYGYALALQGDGKILVAGRSHNGADYDMALWRLAADGTMDETFGRKGIVTYDGAAGGDHDSGYGLALQLDGKILVVGESRNSLKNYDLVIWRFNGDGTPDIVFAGNGFAVYDVGAGHETGYSAAIQGDGRILVAGQRRANGNDILAYDMAVWRVFP